MDKVIIINIEDLYPDRRKCLIPIDETFTTVADVERYLKHNFQLQEDFFLESRNIWIPYFTKVDVLKSLEEVRLRIVRPQSENETGRSEEGKQKKKKKKDKKKRKLSLEPDTHPIQNENIEEESVTQVKKKKKRREENARESSIIVVGEDDNMIPKKEKKKKKKDRDTDISQSSDLPSIIVENGERIENDDKEVDGGTAESEQVETPNRRKRIRKRKKKSEKKLELSVDVLAKAKEQAMLLVNSRLNFAASSWSQPTRNKHIRFNDNEVEGERKEMTGTALDTSATRDPSSEESDDPESSVATISSKPPNSESKISRSQHEDFEKTVKSPPVHTRNLYSNQSFPNAGESSNMATINPNTSFSKVTESSDKNVKKAENLLEDLDFEADRSRYKVPVYYRKPFSNQTVLITSGVVQTKTEINSIKKPVSEKIGLASFGDEFESSRNSKDRLEIGSRIVHGFEKNNLGDVNEKQEYKNNVGQGSRGAENVNEEFENNVEPIKTGTSVEDGNNESMEVLKSDEAIASIRKSKNSITVTIEKLNNSPTIEKIREELNVQCVNKTEKEDVGEGEQEESDKSGGSCLKRMKFSDEDSGEGTNGMEVDEDVEKVEDRDSKQEKVSVKYCENVKDIKLYDKDGEKLMIEGMSVTELSIGNNSHNKEIVVNKDFLKTKIEDVSGMDLDMGEERFSSENNPSNFNEIGENYEESEKKSDSNENCDKECATEIGTHENGEEREERRVSNENGDECGTDEGTHENGEEGRGNEGKQEEDRVEENGDKRETDVKNYENGNNDGGNRKGEDRRQEPGNKENGEKERVTVTKTHENRDNGGDETKSHENRDNGGNEDVEGNKDERDSNENPGNEGKKDCQKSEGTGNVGIRKEGTNEGNMKNGKYVRTMKKKGKIESTNRVKLSALSVLPLPSIGKVTAPMRLPEAKPKPRQDVTYTTPEFCVGDIISFKTLFMGSSAMPIVTDEIIGKILAIKEKIKLEVFCGTVKLGSVRNRLSNEDCDDDLKEFLPGSVVLLSLSEMIGPRKVEQVLPTKKLTTN